MNDDELLYPPAEWFTDVDAANRGTEVVTAESPPAPGEPPQRVVIEHWVYNVNVPLAPAPVAAVRRSRGQRLWDWLDPRRWLWLGLFSVAVDFAGVWLLLAPMPIRAVGVGVMVLAAGLVVCTVALFALRWIVPLPWPWRVAAARGIVATVMAAAVLFGVLMAVDVATAGPPPPAPKHQPVKR